MISGIDIYPDLITEEEEQLLIETMDDTFSCCSNFVKYGYKRDPIPEWLLPAWEKLNAKLSFDANRVNINRFLPGQLCMDAHKDFFHTEQAGGESISMGLISDGVMTMSDEKGGIIQEVPRPPRQAVKLSGDAFFEYKHRIEITKELRYSIVLFSTLNI